MSANMRLGRGGLRGIGAARLVAAFTSIAPSLALAQTQTGTCPATPAPNGTFTFAGTCTASSSSLIGLTGTGATGPGGSGADLFYSATDGGPGSTGPALAFSLLPGAQLLQQAGGGNGLYFSSTGGIGGTGGHDADFRHAGDGGSGGDGGVITITIVTNASVATTGDNANAVYAISSGGTGGQGGADVDGGLGDGNGGPGGNGGDISVVNNGTLSTGGTYSSAIFAHSEGGAGGDGSPAESFFGNGGSGGVGGNSGADVSASNTGMATTSGANATAIVLQSVGGNGGDGGGGTGAFYSQGGSGGNGGNGEDIQFANSGTIQTQGDHADAVNAYSIGGGGGHGGSALTASEFVGVAIGGSGGGGGDSGSVTLTNAGSIVTAGTNAKGMVGSSIGGGGGDANAVTDITYGASLAWNFSFGGSGGMGGTGAAVSVTNQAGGSIITGAPADNTPQDPGNTPIPGDHASGMLAQSLGGGGGHGAQTISVAASAGYADLSLGVELGGSGGAGGNGGAVTVTSDGAITTHARLADGILAQSIGGGGGKGGTAISVDASVAEYAGNLSFSMGGSGGSGGNGAAVSADLGGSISTYSSQSRGILAQSVGGGGGSGGNIIDVDAAVGRNAVNLGVSLGGGGGGGGAGSTVSVTTDVGSAISTLGHYSDGILAQSVGGGGGSGGTVNSYAISAINGSGLAASANIGVGGNGGIGGTAGAVTVAQAGAITTAGDLATGVFVQSVGGGGGVGGSVFELSVAASLDAKNAQGNTLGGRDISASISVGGAGGEGNMGGDVTVGLQSGASIATTGQHAAGIVAQSVGGGGGAGGMAHSFAVSTPVPTSPQRLIDQIVQWMVMAQKIFDKKSDSGEPDGQYKSGLEASISVGGNGGVAGMGGHVTVNLAADTTIQTSGANSAGAHAQSVGGGGGIGGMANSNGFAGFGEYGLALSIGGNGGGGNDGGKVLVAGTGPDGVSAGIVTSGQQSAGIFAQSIGGGGGSGASADSSNYSVPGLSKKTLQMAFGGSAGAQGNGGGVSVTAAPNIVTSGGGSAAIFAQSVGGGGGSGGASDATGIISFSMGGSGGGGGDGGAIGIEGDALLATSGATSAGIVAQSVGGGGGAGGISSAKLFGLNAGLHLSLGGDGGSAGQGGDVHVEWTGGIHTSGAVSMGVFAQSIGGGGGLVQADTLTVVGGGIAIPVTHAGGAGDGGRVTVRDDADDLLAVTTSGAGAHGIVAQSIGGSGSALIIDQALDQFDFQQTFGGTPSGAGGDIVVMLNGSIVTSGANAYGIVAQSLTNATVLFGTDGIQIGQEPVSSGQGSVNVQLQGTVTTTGSSAHGIATYMNTTNSGPPVVQVSGTVDVSGAGAWGVFTTNGLAITSGAPADTLTTQVSVLSGGTINATGAAAGAINMADWNGGAFVDVAGTLNAPDGIAVQSNASGGLNVEQGGVVVGDIVTTGTNFDVFNDGSITGSVSGVSTYSIGGGAHFLRFDPTATLGSDSLSVQQLQVPVDSVRPILTALPNGAVTPTRIITLNNGMPDEPVPADKSPPPFGLYGGTVATDYTYAYTQNTASITDVSIDFTRGGFSGNTQQLANLANSHLLGWPADAPSSPSALYTLLVNASNATTNAQLAQYLQNLDATASYASVQQSATAAGAAHAGMQSCGNPVGLYSLIDQSSCHWAKAIYSVTTLRDGDQHDRSAGISIGRQGAMNDNIYVGASFAYESTSFDGVGSSSDGDRISLGAIAKYVDGPFYASASVVGSYGWADGSRSSSLPWATGLAYSDQETWALTGRLRAGYVFKLGQLELMPLVDFDMLGVFDQGYTEQGLDDLAFHVAPSNNVLFDLRPALRIGGTMKMNDAFITSYIELGALFALNEGSVDVSLVNGPNPAASVPLALERDEVMATLAVGSAFDWGQYELRLLYEGAWGDTTISQTGSVKFAIKF